MGDRGTPVGGVRHSGARCPDPPVVAWRERTVRSGDARHPETPVRDPRDRARPCARGSALLISTLLATALALAAPRIEIEAVVADDLRSVTGVLRAFDVSGTWVDPLAHLPEPSDDLQLFRTYPSAPDRGAVRWSERDGALHFTAELPRRFGAIGWTRAGLFANGGWYPQLLDDEGLPVVEWRVTVRLPEGAGGALGDGFALGDVLRWTGEAERAPLAVVPRPRVTPVSETVTLLTRGRPRRALVRELERLLAAAPVELGGVVVQAPLRRRLTYAGPGTAYVSDRAFRLTPGFRRYHRVAVFRGLAAGLLGGPAPFERELAAAALAQHRAGALGPDSARGLLGAFAWIPPIDALLSSRRMAFYGEILGTTHPTDPVRDDLVEVLDPHAPGTVVRAQLDLTFGEGTAERVGLALAHGARLEEAAREATVPIAWLDRWRAPYPDQDYTLSVERDAVVVGREAPPDAPEETARLLVDGQPHALQVPPGGSVRVDLTAPPRRVVLDPEGHLGQRSRRGESWPPRYTVTFAAGIDTINLNRGQFYGFGQTSLRKRHDTRNLWFGTVHTSPGTLVGAGVTWLRKAGPLQDGWNRPHRLTLGGGVSLLDPDFAHVDRVRPSVSASVGYSYDTRVSTDFPLRGYRWSASVGGGGIPGTDERWGSAGLSGTALLPLHPRHVLAGRLALAGAASNVPWRLLSLGGTGALRSLPVLPACREPAPDAVCAEQADLRAVAAWEYRVAPLREASIPAFLAWGNELQLAVGLEGVVARVDGAPASALGFTAGIAGSADLLGAHTELLGITAGWPLLWSGLDHVERTAVPEIYLRWGQAF